MLLTLSVLSLLLAVPAVPPTPKAVPPAPPKAEWCGPGKPCDCWLNEAWARGAPGHAWADGNGWRKNPCLLPTPPSPSPKVPSANPNDEFLMPAWWPEAPPCGEPDMHSGFGDPGASE